MINVKTIPHRPKYIKDSTTNTRAMTVDISSML